MAGLKRACQRFLPRESPPGILLAMKFRVLVEYDPLSKRWSATFPELPGCASAGDTEAEALENAREAWALWFEPVPVEMSEGAKLVELSLP